MNAPANLDWAAANQVYLAAAVERVRLALVERVGGGTAGMTPNVTASPPAPMSPPSGLDILVDRFGLSAFERDLLLLCAGAELDARFAELCRQLGAQGCPTFSLALAALPAPHWSAITPNAPLRYWKMIETGPGGTLVAAPLRIDERILHFLAGVSYTDERLQFVTRSHRPSNAELPRGHVAVADEIAALWLAANEQGEPFPAIQMIGGELSALEDIAFAACGRLGLDMRVAHGSEIPGAAAERQLLMRVWRRESTLARSGLLVVTDDSDSPESRRAAAAFVEWADIAVIVAGREPMRAVGRALVRFDVGKPTRGEQAAIWRRTLATAVAQGGGDTYAADACIDRIVDQFNMDAPAIANVGALVSHAAGAPGAGLPERLWEACRSQARARLDDLAERVESAAEWDDLVLPALQKQILRDIVVNVRQRGTVHHRWGFSARGVRGLGVSALFSGVPGTGKTLAAEIIASELRLDLYRIDLSQVVSKYIGETEKNLRRVFDAAEAAGAVLLFDEADALFGKRSEVKDSHDRYANIEVSYLLQKMEAYRGLAILTTNMRQALDTAFMRRIRFMVQFPFPDFAERVEIWRRVFPKAAPVGDLDVSRLARLNVAGGHIRNIAVGAAFAAADEGGPVSMAHLLLAARAEYAKLDRPLTETEVGGWR
jgi:vesicle-fusing ATPase